MRTVARVGTRVLLGLALVVVVGIALAPLSAASAAEVGARRIDGVSDEWTSTPTGPLGPADRDLLVKVRQAGLWEGPAGQMAQTHTTNETVKTVGHHLATDHANLDQITRQVAGQLQRRGADVDHHRHPVLDHRGRDGADAVLDVEALDLDQRERLLDARVDGAPAPVSYTHLTLPTIYSV